MGRLKVRLVRGWGLEAAQGAGLPFGCEAQDYFEVRTMKRVEMGQGVETGFQKVPAVENLQLDQLEEVQTLLPFA